MNIMTTPDHPALRWQTLVNFAVLGTDRSGILAPSPNMPWAMRTTDDPVSQLLTEAAALASYELAGREARANDNATIDIQPHTIDEPTCATVTMDHLARILYGPYSAQLAEWVIAACRTGKFISPELIPAVLRRAQSTKDLTLRQNLLQLAGQRGQWLAQLHPQWHRLYAPAKERDHQKEWETGKQTQRLEMLEQLVCTDRNTAIELLQSTWDQESAEDRAKMLERMQTGLHADDEPWLENLLDDRSKQVKAVAATLLSQLPGSALRQRMIQRLTAFVSYTPASGILLKKKAKLQITLPDATDDAMKRDGLDVRARDGMGTRASLLSQIIALTPLSWWETILSDTQALIQIAMADEWALPLLEGWKSAAIIQRNAQWANQIITEVCLQRAEKKSPINDDWRYRCLCSLLPILKEDAIKELTLGTLNQWKTPLPGSLDAMLGACTFQWDSSLSHPAVKMLKSRLTDKNVVYDNTLRQLITHTFSLRLSPAMADQLVDILPMDADHWSANFRDLIDTLIDTLRFRRQMLAALSQSS